MSQDKEIMERVKALQPKRVKIDADLGRRFPAYSLSDAHVGAIKAAFFAQRPLLVKGDPGVGKTSLAYAIASELKWGLVKIVVNHSVTIDDMLYSIDHLQRMGDANLLKQGEALKPISDYVRPGKVWAAIAPDTLKKYGGEKPHNKPGTVLLIDEIDKADSSLPNALLEILDTGELSIPQVAETIRNKEQHPLFVVITSNGERLLPPAFVRRCAMLDVSVPIERDQARARLMDIYQTHLEYSADIKPMDKEKIIAQLVQFILDQGVEADRSYRPGPSEFLDIVRALSEYPELERAELMEVMMDHLACKSL
ncbi:MAG: MoxR family ATPase [Gammaproteobacteria bacterium]